MVKKISPLSSIVENAAAHHGGEAQLLTMLPDGPRDAKQLSETPDHRYLSAMTKAVFKAGFVWRVIDNKWPDFEQAFHGFDVETCKFLSPQQIDELCMDERIVRNRQKILTVPANAFMVAEVAQQHGSFGMFIANWPDSDYIGLLDYLKKHGQRLGGNSCQYFLRSMGKDGFLLTDDVNRALINAGVIDSPATSKARRARVQQTFNQWREESGYNQAQLSRLLALSIG